MESLRWFANRYLRIDPRSLGLFRILFGLVLIRDLASRWTWLAAFYSNDGVLPNHAHLFQLRESGGVWSVLHAFSHRDEAFTAFIITFLVYLFFTLGWFTRTMAVVSAVCLVSLAGRNSLTTSVGDAFAIAVLLISVFLPLGSRWSIDALRRSFAAVAEQTPAQLNDRATPANEETRASLAALVILMVVGLVPLVAALQQTGGAWVRGDALHYALRIDRWMTPAGDAVRDMASPALLSLWGKVFRACEFAILPLALVPVARRFVRPAAMLALAVVGLTYGVCFDFGAFGTTMLAALPLLVPEETWDAAKRGHRPLRLIYDEDCGICLWVARLVKRLDGRENITFVGNAAIERGEREGLPEIVTPELVARTIVVLDANGRVHSDVLAVSHVLRSLPLLGWAGHLLALPGVRWLGGAAYDRFARHRLDISVSLGLGACGIGNDRDPSAAADASRDLMPGAARLRTVVAASIETVMVSLVFVVFLAATEAMNPLPVRMGLGDRDALLGAASYARITAPWGVWSPEPPTRNEAIVTNGTTRESTMVDVLTGLAPDETLSAHSQHHLGPLWANYIDNLRRTDVASFRHELRRYLTRGGKVSDDLDHPASVTNLKVYWVSAPIAAPGAEPEGPVERTEFLDGTARPTVGLDGEPLRGPQPRHPLRPVR